jgi:tRNA (cytidine/uridine-2'-O-)-methyltransferase
MGFKVDDKKLKRAGLDYWYLLDITYYSSTEDFFEKNKDGTFFYYSTKAKHNHTEVTYPEKTYIVFGKETAGLPRELIDANIDHALRMPMRKTLRCLNLSNAVAIATYEVLRQWGFEGLE